MLDMKNTRTLTAAGPTGNHDQTRAVDISLLIPPVKVYGILHFSHPIQKTLLKPMARDRMAASTNLECSEEVKNRRYGRGGGILGAGVDMIVVYKRMG